MFNIEEELKKLPNKPGVYVMRDKEAGIWQLIKYKIDISIDSA